MRRVRVGPRLTDRDGFLTFYTENNEIIYFSKADLRLMVPAKTESSNCEEDCFKLYPLVINKETVTWKAGIASSEQGLISRRFLYEGKLPKIGSWVYNEDGLELIKLENVESFLFTCSAKPEVSPERVFESLGFHKKNHTDHTFGFSEFWKR